MPMSPWQLALLLQVMGNNVDRVTKRHMGPFTDSDYSRIRAEIPLKHASNLLILKNKTYFSGSWHGYRFMSHNKRKIVA